MLVGYIWKSSEYPWLDVWAMQRIPNLPRAELEFGTAGLHQPEGVLVAKGKIFGRPRYAHLDAGQTATRSYAAFLFKIPSDYHGVERITYESGRFILHERGAGPERDLVMNAGRLFPDEN